MQAEQTKFRQELDELKSKLEVSETTIMDKINDLDTNMDDKIQQKVGEMIDAKLQLMKDNNEIQNYPALQAPEGNPDLENPQTNVRLNEMVNEAITEKKKSNGES